MRYSAFISYSHADSRVAKWLHRRLEGYRVPRRLAGREMPRGVVPTRLRPIFRDREELPTSSDLGGQIRAALESSEMLVVICSPKAAASRWVNEEILCFKRLGRADRILCLIVEGEPNASNTPGLEGQECFPPALRRQIGPDGELSTVPAEPIAADLRGSGDGRRDAFLKLAAGLAGVGFDELKRRELQRQLRRAVVVAAASLLLVVTMTGLAAAALVARREAVRQQAIAVEERGRAEDNFRQARAAVDRFYRKVAEESLLKAEGLQPLRRELLEEALDYYERFLQQREGDRAFALDTAIVRGHVGSILAEVGDPAIALESARAATAELERLHATHPGDAAVTSSLSESLGNEAVGLFRLGRAEESLDRQVRAIDLFVTLADSPLWDRVECHRLWTMRGAFEAGLGMYAEAVRSYERALDALSDGDDAQVAPLGIDLQPGAGGMVVTGVRPRSPADAAGLIVGDVLMEVDDVPCERAEAWGAIRARLEPGRPVPARIRRAGEEIVLPVTPVVVGNFMTAVTRYNLGTLLMARMGEPAQARPWLEQAVDEFERTLLRDTAASADVRDGLGFAWAMLAQCGFHLGDTDRYEQGTREAARVSVENVRANPAVPVYRTTAGVNLTNLSSLLWREDRLAEAAEACEQAIGHFREALQTGGNRELDRLQLLQSIGNLALIRSSLDGPATAIPIYKSAIEATEGFADGQGSDPTTIIAVARLRRNYAACLRRSGLLDDAAAQYDLAAEGFSAIGRVTQQAHGAEDPSASVPQEDLSASVPQENSSASVPLDEAATLEAWRMVVHARRGDDTGAAAASAALRRLKDAVRKAKPGEGPGATITIAEVEAWCEATLQTFPIDVSRAKVFHGRAIDAFESLSGNGSQDSAFDEARRLLHACLVRRDICDGRLADAWKRLPGATVHDLEALQSATADTYLLDVAVSLLADGHEAAASVLRRAYVESPVGRSNAPKDTLAPALGELLECGVDPSLIERLRDDQGDGPSSPNTPPTSDGGPSI